MAAYRLQHPGVSNTDDHLRNHGFLGAGSWQLAPRLRGSKPNGCGTGGGDVQVTQWMKNKCASVDLHVDHTLG